MFLLSNKSIYLWHTVVICLHVTVALCSANSLKSVRCILRAFLQTLLTWWTPCCLSRAISHTDRPWAFAETECGTIKEQHSSCIFNTVSEKVRTPNAHQIIWFTDYVTQFSPKKRFYYMQLIFNSLFPQIPSLLFQYVC